MLIHARNHSYAHFYPHVYAHAYTRVLTPIYMHAPYTLPTQISIHTSNSQPRPLTLSYLGATMLHKCVWHTGLCYAWAASSLYEASMAEI